MGASPGMNRLPGGRVGRVCRLFRVFYASSPGGAGASSSLNDSSWFARGGLFNVKIQRAAQPSDGSIK